MSRHSQQGSALLIVLGFLSFMVVSAVTFSIWMRTERVPSSALRRTVANRYLVKAALAQAMSRVDDAIRSHASPGAWNTNNQSSAYHDGSGNAYDWWESRVFMPPDPEGKDTTPNDPDSRYAPVTKTVSVLNLEALGYLPPPIINDVRFLSRSSWTAKWDYFNFDAGRYAFCAVNVSDMLDINKIAANSPRTSAAAARFDPQGDGDKKPPASRFSLAYLFRNWNGNNFSHPNASGMSAFDKFVHTARKGWAEAPLVSLMDYNLSVGTDNSLRPLWSPFAMFIEPDGNYNGGRYFHQGGRESDNEYVKGAERQPFVTDSWFPQTKPPTGTYVDLSQHQPFKTGMKKGGKLTLREVTGNGVMDNDFWEKMQRETTMFCPVDNYTLFDYLDEDNLPLSLAIPCAERVPMIAAIGPVRNELDVTFEPFPATPREENDGKIKRKIHEAKIKVTSPALSTTIIYPFKDDGRDNGSYEAEAFLRLIFVATKPGEDRPEIESNLRSDVFANKFHPLKKDWPDMDDKKFELEDGSAEGVTRQAEKGCLLLTQRDVKTYSPDDDIVDSSTPNTAGNNKKIAKMLKLGMEKSFEPEVILQKIESVELNEKGAEIPESKKTTYKIPLRPFGRDGNLITGDPDAEISEEEFKVLRECKIKPYLAVWVRLKDGGDTVDMVPASFLDDQVLNGIDNSDARSPEVLGGDRQRPFMRFASDMTFTFAEIEAGKTAPDKKTWADTSCYSVDPRFNWAPENWLFNVPGYELVNANDNWYNLVFKDEDGSGSVVQTLVKAEFGFNGWGDRARDPFLFVSNSGYLQSVGELAFLPRVSAIDNSKSGASSSSVLGVDGGGDMGYDGKMRTLDEGDETKKVDTMPCARAAWKSYQSYRSNPDGGTFEFGANLYRRGLVNGPQGFYVNPFTHSDEVMLAAIANTPINYWVAGTNTSVKTVPTKFEVGEKNPIFCDMSTSVMSGEDVEKIATFLRHRFEDLACMLQIPPSPTIADIYAIQKIWEDMFDAMDWGGRMSNNDSSYTVQDLYEDLVAYINSGSGDYKNDYKTMYKADNGYFALNGFVIGNKPNISLMSDFKKLPHKDELGCSADPLRGEKGKGAAATQCWEKLHDIDRMFLHSYWRDCFANKQQLFLIFVRAESTALGGAGEGTPAQQGGRAVALVWRDPGAPTGADVKENEDGIYQEVRHPHKMRVLFYRQFD